MNLIKLEKSKKGRQIKFSLVNIISSKIFEQETLLVETFITLQLL